MRPSSGSSSPVQLQVAILLQRLLHNLRVQHFLQVDLDEVHLLLVGEMGADIAVQLCLARLV